MKNGLGSIEERKPISAEKMRAREEYGVELGISKLLMMENAGSTVASFTANAFLREGNQKTILLVAGTGNNGGDVFVAARHLAYWEDFLDVSLALIGKEKDIRAEEALTNWKILKHINAVKKLIVDSHDKTKLLAELVHNSEVIIVGIFGTGFKGSPRDLQRRVIEIINESKSARKKIVSVDIPSGMEANSGKFEIAVVSDFTVTMDSPKLGMQESETAKQICGEILIANIGLPP